MTPCIEYDLNGYRISRHSIPQTATSSKDVWFVDEIKIGPGGCKMLKNIAQFDTEVGARNCSAIMWATTN